MHDYERPLEVMVACINDIEKVIWSKEEEFIFIFRRTSRGKDEVPASSAWHVGLAMATQRSSTMSIHSWIFLPSSPQPPISVNRDRGHRARSRHRVSIDLAARRARCLASSLV